MKRIICLLLTVFFMFTLVACSGTDSSKTVSKSTPKPESKTENTEEDDQDNGNILDIIKNLGEKEYQELLENRSDLKVQIDDKDASYLFGSIDDFTTQGGKIIDEQYDPNAELSPFETTKSFDAIVNEAQIELQITNITSKVVKVSQGVISRIVLKDNKAVLPGNIAVGSTKKDVEKKFHEPTYKTETSYTYTITLYDVLNIASLKNVLKDINDINLVTLTFVFEDDVVKEIVITFLDRSFAGVESNIAEPEKIDPSTVTPEKKEELVETKNTIIDKLTEAFKAEGLDVTMDEYTGEISLGEDKILFENDKSELTQESKEYIEKVAKVYSAVMLSKEISSKIDYIEFAGHASKVGTYNYNMKLSKKRAENVRKYFIESLSRNNQKEMEKMSTYEGYSYTYPVYGKDGKIDIAASRRVAIKFYLKID